MLIIAERIDVQEKAEQNSLIPTKDGPQNFYKFNEIVVEQNCRGCCWHIVVPTVRFMMDSGLFFGSENFD